MKRNILAFLTCIILSVILTACGQNNKIKPSQDTESNKLIEINNESPDVLRYKKYINVIDESLIKYNENYQDIRYGTFSGYNYFSNLTSIEAQDGGLSNNTSDYYPDGKIISYFKDDNLMGFRMEIGWNTVGSYQKGGDYKYQSERFLIGNDMVYYSYSTDCNDKKEIPSFMCIDGITQVQYDKENQDYMNIYALNKPSRDKEYISINGILYEIDRKEQTIRKAEDNIAKVYINWCESQQRDIITAEKSFHISPDLVQKLIPKGYNFSKSIYDYSVADINLDGIDDILVKIYPIRNDYVYNGDYSEDSPYRKIDEYGYYQLWILKGMDNGKYKPQKLMDSIVWDETYTLCDIQAFEGGFTMHYSVGRCPFETVLRRFQYNKDKQSWYLAEQYKNSSYLMGIKQGLTISGHLEYGVENLSGSSDNMYYNVSVKNYINGHYKDLCKSGYDDYGYLIKFTNKETADKVTEIVKQELDKVFAAIKKLDECHDVLLQNEPVVFLNANTLVISFTVVDDTENGTYVNRVIPICIDLNTCTRIDFQKYFTTDEFVKLCKDSDINISQLEKLYQHYGDYEYLLKAASPSITLCLTEEGLVILESAEYWPENYTITRDKLVDTKLADFWDDWP